MSDNWLATSTNVEHAFSRGGLTVSKMQHTLSDELTRAATVLGSSVASTRPVVGRLLKSRLFVLSNLLTVTQPPASRDFD